MKRSMKKARHDIGRIFSYGASFLQGLAVTGRYLIRSSVTLQYPKERWSPPARFRGRVALRPKKCISCQMCARICPNHSLEVRSRVGQDKKRDLEGFIYRMDTCLFCGLCAEGCPASAIFMNHEYEFAVYDRRELIMDLMKVDAHVE